MWIRCVKPLCRLKALRRSSKSPWLFLLFSLFRCGRHNRHGRHNGGLYTLISIISFDWVVCYIPSVNIIYMSLIFFNWRCWLLTMCMFSATLNIDFLSKSFETQLIDIGCAFNCFYYCYIYKGEGTRRWKRKHSYTVII